MELKLNIKDVHEGREYQQTMELDQNVLLTLTPNKLWVVYVAMIEKMDKMKEEYKDVPITIIK